MDIPFKRLSDETLVKLIQEFVLREGTDYGHHEVTLAQKIEQVKNQLEQKHVKIMYDPDLDSCTIVGCESTFTAK